MPSLNRTAQPASVRFHPSVHFSAGTAVATSPPEKTTSLADFLFFDPLIQVFTYFSLRPRSIAFVRDTLSLFSPSVARDLPHKELQRFSPISEVTFPSLDHDQKLNLKGYWMPSSEDSEKTMVLGHGYSGDYRSMLATAEHFREIGYNIFLFDFRAHGDSGGLKSSIGFHEGKDIAAAVQFVKSTYPAQSQTLVYMGYSLGAAAMMMTPKTLSTLPDQFKTPEETPYKNALERLTAQVDGIILDSPYASLDSFITRHLMALVHMKPISRILRFLWPEKSIKRFTERFNAHLNDSETWETNYDFPIREMSPADVLTSYAPLAQKPLRLLHGTQDLITPFDHAKHIERRLQQYNKDNFLFVALEGLGHLGENWKPFKDGKKYASACRGGDQYFNPIKQFLNQF